MKISKQEKVRVSYVYEGVKCYVITQNTLNNKFTLWKAIKDNDYEKLKTAMSPVDFDNIVEKDRDTK